MIVCPTCKEEATDGSRFCMYCGGKLPEPIKVSTDPLINKVIEGKYLIKERIGGGAMGSIYKAEHISLSKTVVLKILHRHLIRDESHVKRFSREAKAASRLNHPNCISIIDFGQTSEGLSYIVMEYLAGKDLCRILFEEGPLSYERTIHIISQVLDALDEAHSNGVIHRDLKPENIMIEKIRSDPDFVKVLDFGIAKIQDLTRSEQAASFKTATGMVFGTPEYMSPEQIRGEELDGRSDLYSLGVVMYQMLTNTLPFEGESVIEVATKHLRETPTPIEVKRPGIPPKLSQFVMRLLSKKREDRFQSAAEAKKFLLESVEQDKTKKEHDHIDSVFSRTTIRVERPENLVPLEPESQPTRMLENPPVFPTTTTTSKKFSSFGNLLLLILVLFGAAIFTFLVVTILGGKD